jgi:hypothetical protein
MGMIKTLTYGGRRGNVTTLLTQTNLSGASDATIGIWIGNTVPLYRVNEIVTTLQRCMSRLREAGVPGVTTGAYQHATGAIGARKDAIALAQTDGITGAPTEGQIAVFYGQNYPASTREAPGSTQLCDGQFATLLESYAEFSKLNNTGNVA